MKKHSSSTSDARPQSDRVYNNISKGNEGLDLMGKKRRKKNGDDDDDNGDDEVRQKNSKKRNYHSEDEDEHNSSFDHMFDDEGDHFRYSSRNHSYKQEPQDILHLQPPEDSREETDFDADPDKSFDPSPSTPASSASASQNLPSTSALSTLNRTSLAQLSPRLKWLTEKTQISPPISNRLRISRPLKTGFTPSGLASLFFARL